METENPTPITMTLTLDVQGKEGLTAKIEYRNTTLETVKLVENAIMSALSQLNL